MPAPSQIKWLFCNVYGLSGMNRDREYNKEFLFWMLLLRVMSVLLKIHRSWLIDKQPEESSRRIDWSHGNDSMILISHCVQYPFASRRWLIWNCNVIISTELVDQFRSAWLIYVLMSLDSNAWLLLRQTSVRFRRCVWIMIHFRFRLRHINSNVQFMWLSRSRLRNARREYRLALSLFGSCEQTRVSFIEQLRIGAISTTKYSKIKSLILDPFVQHCEWRQLVEKNQKTIQSVDMGFCPMWGPEAMIQTWRESSIGVIHSH
jgi:hypothetical protein